MKRLLLTLFTFFALSVGAFAAVNLNTATKEELDTVKGIGPAKAQAIIEYRKQHGPFKSVDDLKNVKGFGDKSVAKMRGELTVSGATSTRAEPAKVKGGKAEGGDQKAAQHGKEKRKKKGKKGKKQGQGGKPAQQ